MNSICMACNAPFNLRAIGQYFCDDCHTDPLSHTARSNLTAGGFTTTSLTPLSEVTKDTSTEKA